MSSEPYGGTCDGALRASFVQAVNQNNYKNGVFKQDITLNTTLVEAITTFLVSNHVTDHEREIYFRPMLRLAHELARHPETSNNNKTSKSHLKAVSILSQMGDLFEVFERDMQARGQYVQPMTFQTMNPDGTVKETVLVDRNGNRTVYAGGEIGKFPGAPSGFQPACSDVLVVDHDKMSRRWEEQQSQSQAESGQGGEETAEKKKRKKKRKQKKRGKKAKTQEGGESAKQENGEETAAKTDEKCHEVVEDNWTIEEVTESLKTCRT